MNTPMDSLGSATLVLALALSAAFMPLILIASKSRKALVGAALVLCLISVAGLVFSTSVSVLASVGLQSIFTTGWLASLFCALAALIDFLLTARHDEMLFRLLNNDSDGLKPPKSLQRKYRGISQRPKQEDADRQ